MLELAGEELVDIDGAAADVWQYRLDFTNLPEYNRSVRGVRRVEEGSGAGGVCGVGARYEFTLDTVAGPHPVTLSITDALEGERISAGMVGGMSASETFVVRDLEDRSGCRVSLTLWLDLPDGLEEPVAAELLAGGRREIRGELDLIREVFAHRAEG